MASRTVDPVYIPHNETVPAGTAIAAPRSTPIILEPPFLLRVSVRIPPGPSGLTGLSIQYAGVGIVPWSTRPSWIIGDDDLLTFDVGFEVGNGLDVVTYNTGTFDHTFYLRFQVTQVPVQTPSGPAPFTPLDIAALPSVDATGRAVLPIP